MYEYIVKKMVMVLLSQNGIYTLLSYSIHVQCTLMGSVLSYSVTVMHVNKLHSHHPLFL